MQHADHSTHDSGSRYDGSPFVAQWLTQVEWAGDVSAADFYGWFLCETSSDEWVTFGVFVRDLESLGIVTVLHDEVVMLTRP